MATVRKAGYKWYEDLYEDKISGDMIGWMGDIILGIQIVKNDSKLNFIKAIWNIFPGQWDFFS